MPDRAWPVCYDEFSVSMIPHGLPLRLEPAWLTGSILALCSLTIQIGYRPRTAAAVEGLTMLSFVALGRRSAWPPSRWTG